MFVLTGGQFNEGYRPKTSVIFLPFSDDFSNNGERLERQLRVMEVELKRSRSVFYPPSPWEIFYHLIECILNYVTNITYITKKFDFHR